jgi:hypothetical protein
MLVIYNKSSKLVVDQQRLRLLETVVLLLCEVDRISVRVQLTMLRISSSSNNRFSKIYNNKRQPPKQVHTIRPIPLWWKKYLTRGKMMEGAAQVPAQAQKSPRRRTAEEVQAQAGHVVAPIRSSQSLPLPQLVPPPPPPPPPPQIVPLSKLPLDRAMNGVQSARIEQWIELETLHDAFTTSGAGGSRSPSSSKIRNPSILMEICFSSYERMDASEDDMDEDDDTDPQTDINASFSKRASMKIRSQIKEESPQKEMKEEEPVLQPGIIDFLCVVGA